MQDREGAVVRLDRLASDDRHLALLQGGTQVRRGHGQMEERDESLPLEVLVLGGRRTPHPHDHLGEASHLRSDGLVLFVREPASRPRTPFHVDGVAAPEECIGPGRGQSHPVLARTDLPWDANNHEYPSRSTVSGHDLASQSGRRPILPWPFGDPCAGASSPWPTRIRLAPDTPRQPRPGPSKAGYSCAAASRFSSDPLAVARPKLPSTAAFSWRRRGPRSPWSIWTSSTPFSAPARCGRSSRGRGFPSSRRRASGRGPTFPS